MQKKKTNIQLMLLEAIWHTICLTLQFGVRVIRTHWAAMLRRDYYTVDGFIFVGTNFRRFNKNGTFVGFKIRCHSIFLHNSYRKLLIRWYWNSWIGPSTKTRKICTPQKLSHSQYVDTKLTSHGTESHRTTVFPCVTWRTLCLTF